jgi:NhaP-type Na+/H+ or K+/H+ antiporter
MLSLESAASHGFGYLLVLLPVLLFTKPAALAWSHWLTQVLLWDGLAAMIVGGVIGYFVGEVHKRSIKKGLTEKGLLIVIFLALALVVMAVVKLMDSDGLLAVMVAGITYARVRVNEKKGEGLEKEEQHYEEVFKQLLQVPVFVLVGISIPWDQWLELGWAGLGLVVAVLFLRRVPALLIMKPLIPQVRRWDEALFMGWFGPIGVGALHFALLAEEHTHLEPVWVVGSLLIVVSTVVHDLTLTPFAKWLHHRRSGEQENGS